MIADFLVDFHVRGYDCGYGGVLRALPLANFFQEAAGEHAASLGLGMAELAATGKTWMLARMDFRVDAPAKENLTFRVRTRPSGLDRLFALRDLTLEDAEGKTYVRAVYAYLVIDTTVRKPLRPDRALPIAPLGEGAHCVPDYRFGSRESSLTEPRYSLTAAPRHIDDNGHANNAHILDWLVDAAILGLPAASKAGRGDPLARLASLRVDFISEILEGDVLEARSGPLPETGDGLAAIGSELMREGKAVARAESSWRPEE